MTDEEHRLLIWANEFCPWSPSCDRMHRECIGNGPVLPYCPRNDTKAIIAQRNPPLIPPWVVISGPHGSPPADPRAV